MKKKLTVLTLVTKSYIKILDNYFLPTLPKDIDTMKILYVNDLDNCRYSSVAKFLEKKRLEMIYEEIKANMGHNVMFIDADVVFSAGANFKNEINDLLKEKDILFQYNDTWYNFGVFAINCNERTEQLFRHFLEKEIDKVKDIEYLHDQHQINALLGFNHGELHDPHEPVLVEKVFTHVKHGSLPQKYFGNHFIKKSYPADTPEGVVLFHATNTYSMSEKIYLLHDFKHKFYDRAKK